MMHFKEAVREVFRYFSAKETKLFENGNVVNLLGTHSAYREAFLIKLGELLISQQTVGTEKVVVVLQHEKQINDWVAVLSHNLSNELQTAVLPHTKYWGSYRFANQVREENERLRCLGQIAHHEGPLVIFTSLAGLLQTTCDLPTLRSQSLQLTVGATWDLDEFVEALLQRGYQRTDLVSEPGYFAIRGGIIDVFSCYDERPTRIEFLGDEISSIRWFNSIEQRSQEKCDRVTIILAQESLYEQQASKERAQMLYDYILQQTREIDKIEQKGFIDSLLKGYKIPSLGLFLPLFRKLNSSALDMLKGSLFYFPGSLDSAVELYRSFDEAQEKDFQHDSDAGKLSIPPQYHFMPFTEDKMRSSVVVQYGDPMRKGVAVGLENISHTPLKLPDLSKIIKAQPRLKTVILAPLQSQLNKVEKILNGYDISCRYVTSSLFYKDGYKNLKEREIALTQGTLARDLLIKHQQLLFIPAHLLFGEPRKKISQKKSSQLKAILDSFKDLSPGSLIVHIEHGIGRFMGMNSMSVGGITSEFLEIEYGAGDKIYLPIDKLSLVQKYSSGLDKEPKLDRLKSQGWLKRKSKAKSSIKQLAINLLEIHAKRKLAQRHSYSAANELYYQFEADFPYEETVDQETCISDVQKDLSSPHPMDRLICGDVGFGKTEIALRAAMRVVMDGLQVILMAPTTVLSFQHFQTFKKRFDNYAVKTGLLNRFVSSKSIRATLENFANGKIDILIGTHRVLSRDVNPKKLGLVIIDEEQRFGVGHKETLKTLRAKVDILSLSATPIPRSLHMAMLGLKDISVLMTPPRARLPIKTFISPWNETIIKKSIEFEVKRGGQVFFVHNRVDNILEIAAALSNLLPDVSFQVAHGQMAERELEKVILAFLDHNFSVLICTTIIESGIDMPNVNTILINQAERFGLAQLYQMRGRVGRSSRQSFAYFLTTGSVVRNVTAQQRLEVLAAHQDLGAGFQVASYDLELRGAGDLLGADQSGRVNDIGIDLYMELLEQEILKLQGKMDEEDLPEPEICINVSAYLPKSYINKESQRLSFYKRLFSAKDEDEVEALAAELEDRFGSMPMEARTIITVALTKVILKAIRCYTLLQKSGGFFELKFSSLKPQEIARLLELPEEYPNRFFLNADYSMMIAVPEEQCQNDLDRLEKLTVYLRKIKGTPTNA